MAWQQPVKMLVCPAAAAGAMPNRRPDRGLPEVKKEGWADGPPTILGTEIQGTHILRPRLTFVLVPPLTSLFPTTVCKFTSMPCWSWWAVYSSVLLHVLFHVKSNRTESTVCQTILTHTKKNAYSVLRLVRTVHALRLGACKYSYFDS